MKKVANSNYVCNLRYTCVSIFMYTDDLMLLPPYVTLLQTIFQIVKYELSVSLTETGNYIFGRKRNDDGTIATSGWFGRTRNCKQNFCVYELKIKRPII